MLTSGSVKKLSDILKIDEVLGSLTIDERWLVRAAPGKPHYDLLGLRPVQVELRSNHSENNRMSMNKKSGDVRIGV